MVNKKVETKVEIDPAIAKLDEQIDIDDNVELPGVEESYPIPEDVAELARKRNLKVGRPAAREIKYGNGRRLDGEHAKNIVIKL